MNTTGLALGWYYHLPSIASDEEVDHHVRRSLRPLVECHATTGQPLLLAPTGSFLRLAARRGYSADIEQIAELADQGLISLGATFHHEIHPIDLDWSMLAQQIDLDLLTKAELGLPKPSWFVPPNACWRNGIEELLTERSIRGALIDSRHLSAASSRAVWEWRTGSPTGDVRVAAIDTGCEPWEGRRKRKLAHVHGQADIELVVRDWPATAALTFGNQSMLQAAPDSVGLREWLAGLELETDLIAVVDDGDRVSPRSIRSYRSILERVQLANWEEILDCASPLPSIRDLGSFVLDGLDRHLRLGADATHYRALLSEIGRFTMSTSQRDQYLALHDVFYAFWPSTSRRRDYLRWALRLRAEVSV